MHIRTTSDNIHRVGVEDMPAVDTRALMKLRIINSVQWQWNAGVIL